jgi:hypothetical protein
MNLAANISQGSSPPSSSAWAPPRCPPDVAFGAGALALVEGRFTDHLLTSWHAGRTSLGQAVAHADDPAAARAAPCRELRAEPPGFEPAAGGYPPCHQWFHPTEGR